MLIVIAAAALVILTSFFLSAPSTLLAEVDRSTLDEKIVQKFGGPNPSIQAVTGLDSSKVLR